jgi:hypothetical protein
LSRPLAFDSVPYRLAVLDEPRPEQLLRPLVVTVAFQPAVELIQHLGSDDAGVAITNQSLIPEAEDAISIGAPSPGVGLDLGSRQQRRSRVCVPADRAFDSPSHDGVVPAVDAAPDPGLECWIAYPVVVAVERLPWLAEGEREAEQSEPAPSSVVGLGDDWDVVRGGE